WIKVEPSNARLADLRQTPRRALLLQLVQANGPVGVSDGQPPVLWIKRRSATVLYAVDVQVEFLAVLHVPDPNPAVAPSHQSHVSAVRAKAQKTRVVAGIRERREFLVALDARYAHGSLVIRNHVGLEVAIEGQSP